jgi:plastocyanin
MLRLRNSIFIVSVALLLCAGAFFTYALVRGNDDHTITLTEDGFKPNHLVIAEGETVTFKTNRGTPFWPASNVHPTHTAYPDFDPKKPIAPDATWSFTFTKAGTYLFHDHIASLFEGEIIVEKKDG